MLPGLSPASSLELKRAVSAEFKVTAAEGIVEGYGATWDRDLGGDRYVKGAFSDVIAEEFPANRVKIYREHDTAIGLPIELKEDETGLYVVAKIQPGDSQDGDETLNLADRGVYDAFSVAWVPDRKEMRVTTEDGQRTRVIGRVASLPHIGILADPMNPKALVTAVKNQDAKDLAAVLERLSAIEAKLERPVPERKGLWDLADALNHMAAVESIRRYGELDDDEARMARELIDHLLAITEETKALLPEQDLAEEAFCHLVSEVAAYANQPESN